ncbi:type II toxin-antitoxin system RelE/ParE family toxin [Candidatus Amarobacter glycogenicus]|uniref:type II toxin-antitoxin system RelE/ParE family toxin n=1 Tax=Candidatus Amarobacter glycogenicus TaxID=3140699 RepID=UPI00313635FF|nr:type II toxin-antitoxin system RelE/ParE family toxin [Dehalococcoidia bacterium]MBK8558365.1 type II toxin-antitoxin system RelE/ParE family toxin [Dehalococcoidia bacterium]MCC6268193.1 type II toxin-antitoxin system RelE/ParE family toxin [Dehalococcoidia bacterium]
MDPEAEAELEAAVDWHLSHSRDVAERFADEYERVIEAIHRFPEIGRPIDGGLRRLNIGRTDYTIIYRLRDDVATILAVAHASRRPGYWRERL